jgi:hypothetical protein
MNPPKRKLLAVPVLVAALAIAAIAAPAADAGVLVASANGCPTQTLSKPFSQWGDGNSYFLAPGGAFESGDAAWTLGGGAKVVSGNEPYKVHEGDDSRSLYIPAGGVATSPTVCVGISEPSIRWFAKQQSLLNLTGAMTVEVGFESSLGVVVWAPVVGAGILNPTWNPSLPGIVEASLLPLLPGDKTPVQFRFRAVTGNWTVDDVYVDPYRSW